jgi:hypothetical protein
LCARFTIVTPPPLEKETTNEEIIVECLCAFAIPFYPLVSTFVKHHFFLKNTLDGNRGVVQRSHQW